MIAEVIIASLAVVTVASLQFAKQVMRDDKDIDPIHMQRVAIQEKRRIMERDRREWWSALGTASGERATREIGRIDRDLLKLAEEEANL